MFLTYLQRRQLSPEPDNTALPPSLDDIEQDDLKNPTPPAPDPKPTDPAAPPEGETDQEKEEREQKEKEAQEEADRLAEEAKKTKPKVDPPAPDPVDDPEDTTEDSFWDDVDKLRGGDAPEIDYGDVDPVSPEGALIRENFLIDQGIAGFEEYIETNYPKAYAFLEHLMAGGKEEDFFKAAGTMVTLPTEAELENSEQLQTDVITRNLTRKGLTEKVIASTIKTMKADDELEEASKAALTEEAKWEKDQVDAVRLNTEAVNKAKTEAVGQINTYIDKVVATGEIGGLVIPEKDRPGFGKAVKDSIRYDNGKFIAITELTNENMEKFFKEKFFSFKNGDLKELVQRQARTENTRRLVKTIVSPTKPKGSSTNGSTTTTLGEID